MTISFFINKNDLQELYFLVDNFSIIQSQKVRDKAVVIECFNSIDTAVHAATDNTECPRRTSGWAAKPFIQVNIDYPKYDKIREYLRF